MSRQLSLAARAFKAQALAVADVADVADVAGVTGEPAADFEVFRRGEIRRPRLVSAR